MRHKRGFTLIELLVVIAIIALLLSVLLPALRIAKERARELICKSNQSAIGKSAIAYAAENNNKMCAAEIPGDITSLWQLRYAPYVGGTSADVRDFWQIEVYNCPSYPDKEQTQDFCVNAWRYVSPTAANSELRGEVNVSAIRNPGVKIHLSEYAYSRWEQDAAGKWTIDTGVPLGGTQIVRPGDLERLDDPSQQANLFNKVRWMDVRDFHHLPNSTVELPDRRVSRGRHKKTGTNNLFFDGHVEWLDAESNDARKWWLKGQLNS